jgi:hypothetical protein
VRLTRAQVSPALEQARRHSIPDKATAALTARRSPRPGQPAAVTAARSACNDRLIDALNARAFSALRTSPGARLLRGAPRAHFTVANAECGIDRNVRVDPMISRQDQHAAARNGRVDRLLTHA